MLVAMELEAHFMLLGAVVRGQLVVTQLLARAVTAVTA
jgi:hypothetical protein